MNLESGRQRESKNDMCINVVGDGRNRELQMLTAGLMQSGGQSGMRAAGSVGQGMQCQGQVSGTQMARQAALSQLDTPQLPAKPFRPLLCVGSVGLVRR